MRYNVIILKALSFQTLSKSWRTIEQVRSTGNFYRIDVISEAPKNEAPKKEGNSKFQITDSINQTY